MKVQSGETFIACFRESPTIACLDCGQHAYRTVVIRSETGAERHVHLCGKHFIEACTMFPVIRDLDQGTDSFKVSAS